MNIALVTGATGFVGSHLVEALCANGWTVRVLAMPTEDTVRLEQAGVTVYRGDVRRPESLIEPIRGADVVFHLAGIHGLWRPKREYYDVNVTGTQNVCRSVLGSSVRRLVHVSSWTVYGLGLGETMHEGLPLRPPSDSYTLSKAEADELVQRYITREHLPAIIVRAGTMFGPGDHVNFARMADRLAEARAIIIGSGSNALPFVYVKNVVEGLIHAANRKGAEGQIYNLSDDHQLTQEQFWNAIAEEIAAAAPRLRIPYNLLYALGWISERSVNQDNPRRQPLITRLGVKLFGTDNRIAIDKARHELGYIPRTSVREGVHLAAAWYLRQKGDAASAVKSRPQNLVSAR